MNLGINNSVNSSPNFRGAFKFVDKRLALSERLKIGEGESLYKDVKKVIDTPMSWYKNNVLFAVTDSKKDDSIIKLLNEIGVRHLYVNDVATQKMEKSSSLLDHNILENLFG